MASSALTSLQAQVTFTWVGVTAATGITDSANWGGTAPTSDPATTLAFGSTTVPTVNFPSVFTLGDITFTAAHPAYTLNGDNSTLTLHGGINVGPGESVTFNNTLSIALSNGPHTIDVSSPDTTPVTIHGNISEVNGGVASITKSGGGRVTLTGANTYSGGTVIEEGTLAVGGAGALGSGGIAFNGGTLKTTANFSLGAPIALDAGGGTLSPEVGTTLTYTGLISGASMLAKTGGGTLVLAGTVAANPGSLVIRSGTVALAVANTLAPNTDVSVKPDGESTATLAVNANQTLRALTGDGEVAIADARQLTINLPGSGISSTAAFSGSITGSGSSTLVQEGAGTFTFTGTASSAGAFKLAVKSGTFELGDGELAGEISGDIDIGAPGTFIYNTAGIDAGFSFILSGTGTFRKLGDGNLTLTAANPFSGKTQVEAGTLTIGADHAISAGAAVSVDENATFAIGRTVTIGSLEGAGSTVIAEYRGLIIDGTNRPSTLYSGSIAGGGSLTKAGPGMLTLSGENFYSRGTFIRGGILRLWTDGALPPGRDVTINGTNGPASLELDGTTQSIGALTFGGSDTGTFATNSVVLGAGATLTLEGDVTYDSTNGPAGAMIAAQAPFSSSSPFGGTLELATGPHEFAVDHSENAPADLTIYSNVTDAAEASGGITKIGAGSLLLAGSANTFSGSVTVLGGTLLVASDHAAGTGTLTLKSGTTLAASGTFSRFSAPSGFPVLPNDVAIESGATLGTTDNSAEGLALSGRVTLPNGTIHLGGDNPVWLTGSLAGTEAGAVTFDSGDRTGFGLVVLGGHTTTSFASLTADNAAIVIANADALVPTLKLHASNGYIGVAKTALAVTAPSPSAVLGAIKPDGFSGTFGFDSEVDAIGIHTFDVSGLDFSAFNGSSFTLGSMTAAEITGSFTPPATGGYVFGNGGGKLFVGSVLQDVGGQTQVTVSSLPSLPRNALTVVFQGANTYTGNLGVSHSIAILDSETALPAGSSVTLGLNGYLGATGNFADDFATVASRITGYTSTSVLGLDSASFLQTGADDDIGEFTGAIDLTDFGSVYLGTATRMIVSGPVLAPNQTGANRTLSLMATDKAALVVNSPLVAGHVNKVVVGSDADVLGSGAVGLRGANTYSGGTTLLGGLLLVDHSSRQEAGAIVVGPLGTGALTVPANATKAALAQHSKTGDVVLHNPIVLDAPLQVGRFDQAGEDGEGFFYGDWLVLDGAISGAGHLEVLDNVVLNGANTFSGGVTLRHGMLGIGHDNALGSGLLRIQPLVPEDASEYYAGVVLSAQNGDRTISNDVELNLFGTPYLPVLGDGSLTITGNVTLQSDTVFLTGTNPLFLEGNVSGFGELAAAAGTVVLRGTNNTYSGGTRAAMLGSVIFREEAAIPTMSRLTADYLGYIGLATPPAMATNLQANFLDRFDKDAARGTIGFDTPIGAPVPSVFAGNIDLKGFNEDAKLGSWTTAILNGTIMPATGSYRFGGGGGLLEVNSDLTDRNLPEGGTASRNVDVASSSFTSLTVRLGGTNNTYSGGTYVSNSALIFKAGAMPEEGWFVLEGGYVGTEDPALEPSAFFARFDHVNGVLGFDSFGGTYQINSGTITLPDFANVYLGTATSATVGAGATILPAGGTVYRFAGYKGGQLTVASTLSDESPAVARSVVIGDPDSPATAGSPTNPDAAPSTVTLTGTNTYQGGTTLYAGKLIVGNAHALGTNTVTVGQGPFHGSATLAPGADNLAIENALALQDDLNIDVDLDGGGWFTLSGAISSIETDSGFHEIHKLGGGTLRLSGENSSYSDIYIADGNVTFASAGAVGNGALLFGVGPNSSATFLESSTVRGISGDHGGPVINFGANTLTIDQRFDGRYAGKFSGSGALVFTAAAPAQLLLTGNSTDHFGLVTIRDHVTVIAGHSNALGSSAAVTLDQGTLAVGQAGDPLSLDAAAIRGIGTVALTETQTVGSGFKLGPGIDGIGALHFDGSGIYGGAATLALAGGGTYEWNLTNATDPTSGWDKISVDGKVDITATSDLKFDFRLTPLASDLNLSTSYAWTLLTATGGITGFAATKFNVIPTGGFLGAVDAGGSFSLDLGMGGNSLLLSFVPVPEPSTWALLLTGLAIFGLASRRRWR